jgi:hypothetical protein
MGVNHYLVTTHLTGPNVYKQNFRLPGACGFRGAVVGAWGLFSVFLLFCLGFLLYTSSVLRGALRFF